MFVLQNVHSASVITRWLRAAACTSPAISVVMSFAADVSRHSNVERFLVPCIIVNKIICTDNCKLIYITRFINTVFGNQFR